MANNALKRLGIKFDLADLAVKIPVLMAKIAVTKDKARVAELRLELDDLQKREAVLRLDDAALLEFKDDRELTQITEGRR